MTVNKSYDYGLLQVVLDNAYNGNKIVTGRGQLFQKEFLKPLAYPEEEFPLHYGLNPVPNPVVPNFERNRHSPIQRLDQVLPGKIKNLDKKTNKIGK